MRRLLYILAACLAFGVSGCTAPTDELYAPNDPSIRIPMAKRAVRDNDRKKLRLMFEDLSHDDPATRLFAIQGLQRMTGERFGYVYYATEEERAPAVHSWRQYLESLGVQLPASRPTTAPATRSGD